MAVLLLGVAVGVMIGGAFFGQGVVFGGKPAGLPAPKAPQTVAAAPLDCAIPFSPHLIQAVSKGEPITVGVFGDSFGDGVWAALYHLLPKGGNYKVERFSKESTGFTRYASLNLEDEATSQIAGQNIDIAVIDFGANDTQGIYDGSHAYALLSDGWKQVYGARMDRFVGLLRANGAMVYWVGLPKMRKPAFDQQISDMGAFYAQRMAALGVPYIEVEPLSLDANGQYNDHLTDPGSTQPRLMRATDGVHMTMAGYERLAAPVVRRIQAYVDRARAAGAVDGPPPASVHAEGGPSRAAPGGSS
jgi:hypothetical protein